LDKAARTRSSVSSPTLPPPELMMVTAFVTRR
jgi:hypothetical protein